MVEDRHDNVKIGRRGIYKKQYNYYCGHGNNLGNKNKKMKNEVKKKVHALLSAVPRLSDEAICIDISQTRVNIGRKWDVLDFSIFFFFLDKKIINRKTKNRMWAASTVVLEMAEIEGQKVYETPRKLIGWK